MSYCTLADLIEQYSEQKIREVSDRVNKPATTIDTVIVDRAIADADSEIDLHLHGRYQLPLASVPTALKRIACGLAYANLHIVLKEENPVYKTAEHLRKLLSGIANGKLSLALDADGKPAPVANTVQISEGRNDWGGRLVSDPFDYLFLEPLLIERIRSEVPGLAIVSGVPDLAALSEQDQPAPSVYVVYLGDEIGTGADHQGGRRAIQAIGQQWAVVLVVHYADSSNSGEGARREAGPLLGRLVKALTGWAPAIDVAPLARSARQSPVTYASGYFYFPLVFTARFVYPRVKSWKP